MKERINHQNAKRGNKYHKINFRKSYSNNITRHSHIYHRNTRHKLYYNHRENNYRKRYKEKLTNEKLDDDLDNYFKKEGNEAYKNFLDNDIDMYLNKGGLNENSIEKLQKPPTDNKNVKTIKIEKVSKKEENNSEKEKEKHNIKISVTFKGK